jgi:hypothetical protein
MMELCTTTRAFEFDECCKTEANDAGEAESWQVSFKTLKTEAQLDVNDLLLNCEVGRVVYTYEV